MPPAALETRAPIPTWFGIGGGADALARPTTLSELREIVGEFRARGEPVRALGDGANLLVDDAGVDGVVIALDRLSRDAETPAGERTSWGALPGCEIMSDHGGRLVLRASGGVNLPRLIVETVRQGLGGLEVLAGVPATVGGAAIMNAGGTFGQFADVALRVRALSLEGVDRWLDRSAIAFAYRRSGLEGSIVTEVEMSLTRHEGAAAGALRERMKEIMALKKKSQPMAERSAGCFWKNPGAPPDWSGPRTPDGARVGAGWLIDHAGLKGLRVGGASVSDVHANFVVTDHDAGGAPRCAAGDVLALMRDVRTRVFDRWGVTLEPEVVIWRRAEWDVRSGGRCAL